MLITSSSLKGCCLEKLKFYIMAHLWEPCLPGNQREAKIPLFSSQETSCPGPPVNGCRKEEMTTTRPESARNQEMLDLTPSPFSRKEACILTQARWFAGARAHHLLGQLAFWMKLLFLGPNNSSLRLLACRAASSTGLDSVTASPSHLTESPPREPREDISIMIFI